MPDGILVVGTPGSGKTTFASKMYELLTTAGKVATFVNLDPANEFLEVTPDIDIQELITVGDAMNARQGCKEKDFVFMRDLLTLGLPELPSFIIPGDK